MNEIPVQAFLDGPAYRAEDPVPVEPLDPVSVEPLDPVMVAEVLEALALRQEAVERAVDTLSRRVGTTPREGPWAWRALGPGRRRELLTQLRDWVDWLITRYELRAEAQTIPPCWYRHPVAVEELTALMVAWHAAYTADEGAPSDALINWHDRWLWPALHRLNVQLRIWPKCTGGTHEPARTGPPLTSETDFTTALDQLTTGTNTNPREGRDLSEGVVRELLASHQAEELLPDDARTPIRYQGRWYGVPDGGGSDAWTPLDDERNSQLDAMSRRLREARTTSRPA